MAKTSSTIEIKIGVDSKEVKTGTDRIVADFSSAYGKIKQELAAVTVKMKELAQQSRAGGNDRSGAAALAAQQVRLRAELTATVASYKELATVSQARTTLNLTPHADITAEINKARAAYTALASSGKLSMAELAQAKVALRGQIETLTAKTNGWREALSGLKMGLLEAAAAIAPTVLAIGAAVKFESSMAGVKKVVEATPEAFAVLRGELLALTRTLPLTADELAQIAAAAGQLGIATKDIAAFTQVTAKMATAFDMSAEAAGDSIGKIKNIYKLSIAEVETFGDAINQLGNTSAARERDIVDVMQRIGGAAQQFGLATTEAAALAAAMLSLGKAPEVASTSINSLLNRMQTATMESGEFQDALAKIGLSAQDMAAQVAADPQAAIENLLTTLSKLDGQKKAEVLTGLFGREFQDDIAVLVSGLQTYQEALGQVAEKTEYAGSMNKEFAARAATTENQLILMKNAVREAGINLGTVFLPAIKNILRPITAAIRLLADFAAAFPQISAALVTLATSAVILGPLVKAFEILKMMMLGAVGQSAGVIGAFKGINLAALTLRTTLTVAGGVLAAFGVGWAVGEILAKFDLVKTAANVLIETFELARLKVAEWWAMLTGGDVAAVRAKAEQVRQIFGEMNREIAEESTKGGMAALKTQLSAEEAARKAHIQKQLELRRGAKWQPVAAELQLPPVKAPEMDAASWQAFQDKLDKELQQMGVTASQGELALAEAALAYSRQGMDAAQAENLLRTQKLGLLDAEIRKYQELQALVPTNAPGQEGADARAEMDAKINGLRVQRLGLLKAEVEASRKLDETNAKAAEDEIKRLRLLEQAGERHRGQMVLIGLEEQKIEAGRLPTVLARMQAEAAIDEQISAKKIALKQAEIASLDQLDSQYQQNLMRAEEELLGLRIDGARQRAAAHKAETAEMLRVTEDAWRKGKASVEEYRRAVQAAAQAGAMDMEEANRRMILAGADMVAAAWLGFEDFAAGARTMAEFTAQLMTDIYGQLASGMTEAIMAFGMGTKTAKDAFMDFARATLEMIAKMILQQLIYNAIIATTHALGYATGGEVQGLATGGRVLKFAPGGRIPGSSPNSRADNIPIWATAGEFMHPVSAVRKYGLGFMESVRAGIFPLALAKSMDTIATTRAPSNRLADGGAVAGFMAGSGGSTVNTNLRVVNVLDKNMVGDYLQTPGGETVLLNMIRRNGSSIKTILG